MEEVMTEAPSAQFPVEFEVTHDMSEEESLRDVWGPIKGLAMVSPTHGLETVIEATWDEVDRGDFRVKILGWADEPAPDWTEADEQVATDLAASQVAQRAADIAYEAVREEAGRFGWTRDDEVMLRTGRKVAARVLNEMGFNPNEHQADWVAAGERDEWR